jgi:hypothetical protein
MYQLHYDFETLVPKSVPGNLRRLSKSLKHCHHLTCCEADACAIPCIPPHGPFNQAQDETLWGVRSSKLGIKVTKSGFSSNVCSLQSHLTFHIIRTTCLVSHHSRWMFPLPESPFHNLHLTYKYNTTCYAPWEWYSPTNSGYPGLGFLFPHLRTHQFADVSLVWSSFHSTKPLQTYSDVSGRVFQPIANHLWPRNLLPNGTVWASTMCRLWRPPKWATR